MNNKKLRDSVKNISQSMQRNERGQATLEFAFAVVVIIIVTLGMIDFGRAVYTKSVVEAASQEGARVGIVNIDHRNLVDVATTEAAVRDRMFALDANTAVIDVVQNGTDVVEVTVTYNFRFVTPLISSVVSGGMIELVGTSSMVRQ